MPAQSRHEKALLDEIARIEKHVSTLEHKREMLSREIENERDSLGILMRIVEHAGEKKETTNEGE